MSRGRAAVTAAAILAAAAVLSAAAQVKVTPVVSDGRVLASFTAVEVWTTEVRELLQIGQVVSFAYDVELRRPSTLWLDPLLARTSVRADAKFDTLTGNYQVSRLRDGRVVRSERRDQESAVRDWLTAFEQIELEPESPLKENNDYYVQVRLQISPRRNVSLWSVLPFGGEGLSGRTSFTYLR